MKNREFSENSTPKQACDGLVASGLSKFDRDLRWLNNHLGSFLLLRKTGDFSATRGGASDTSGPFEPQIRCQRAPNRATHI
jgi:hypothetical protein